MNPDRFRLIRSSSQEMLLDQLAGHLRRHNQGKLFTQTVFIVRNNGIKHMLMHRLADREGFFGNALFCYPEDMATLLSTAQNIRNTDIRRLFEFELLQIFSDLDFYRYFTDNLTAKAPGEISRYRLCQKIAHTMLSALDYQPDAFLKGYLPHPKADRLWKKILARKKFMFAHEHYQNIRNQDATLLPVPSEIYVFGVPFLTGFEYLMLSLISEYSDIYYFQQTPSPVYRAERSNQKLPADSVNPVLDYFGRAQQVFERRLLNDNAYNLCEDFFPEASKSSSVLNDIRESMAQATDAPLDTIRSGDRSVRIHSCPNALREAETVYNEIVCFLSQHPDARPSDILITALNIRDYQPALDQVFYDNPIKIPYYITDSDEFISGDVYLLLDLLFSAQKDGIHTELLQQILDFACVRQKLGITADNVAKIHQILANIPVYKLIPGKGSEISSAFTAGGYLYESEGRLPQLYDRLLVGYVFENPHQNLYKNVLPYHDLQGMDYEALGRLMRLTDILSEILETDKESDSALFTARTLGGWADYLQQLADILFICPPDNASQMFHAVIAYIRKTAAGLSADVPVNYQVFREFFNSVSREYKSYKGLSGNGICCSSLLNVRGIPFKAVFLMGADTRLFRDNSSADNDIFFDRRLYPEPDLREQRLYNIISLLLNAEHRLHITYNREETVKEAENSVPPELNFINSYLNSQSVHTEANNTHLFLIRHPEDSSDALYFTHNRELINTSLPSYRLAQQLLNTEIISGVQQKNHTSDISFPSAFSDTEQNTGMIDFEDLCGFFENPLQWFCRKRLGIKNITPQGYKDKFYEPLTLSYRQQRSLHNILKENPADKNRQHTALNILRAGGKYPRRSLGRHYLTTAQKEMVRLYNLLPASYSYSPEPLPFHIQLGNYTLQGSLPVQQGLVFKIHAGVVSYQTLIQFCLCRLIAGQVNMSPRPSFLLTYSEKSNLTPLLITAKLTEGNPDNLIKMLDIYREGQLSPFCIFPRNARDNLLKILRNPDKYSPQMKTMARKYTAKIREILKNGNDTDSWNKDAADYAVQILYGGDNPAEMTYERDFKQLADCLLNGLSAESSEAEITKLLLTAQGG